jgi:hypothetical protein
MKRRKSLMIISILLWGLFFISGCGDGVPEGTLNTSGAAVTLTTDTTAANGLSAGQSGILTATLTDKSVTCTAGTCTSAPQSLSKQVITFSFFSNQSGAALTPRNGGITDSLGKAYAIYTAGSLQPGLTVLDIVEANINDFSGFVTITRKGGGASGFRLALTADLTTLAPEASTKIVVEVQDGSGVAVGGGVTVTFDFLENKSGATLSVQSGTTDAGGRVATVYTAGATGDVQDIIRASVTGANGIVIITVTP